METRNATAYLAAPGLTVQLLGELEGILAVHGRLVLAAGARQRAHWAQNIWLNPVRIHARSITDAARQLRSIQRNWVPYSFHLFRRTSLIQARLPHVSAKPVEFPSPPPRAPLGSWALIEPGTILASADCTSPFANGEAAFVEWKEGPPNRAYLKLWEALTLLGRRPERGDRCLDAGCSPGGWTWALARLGASVLAIDRAPLAPSVAALSGVEYRKGSAFSLRPSPAAAFDWIFSDVVSYPERLWEWVDVWLESGAARNFVCTLKFQGDSHYKVIRKFASVPRSRLIHLWHNKHELTWMFPAGDGG